MNYLLLKDKIIKKNQAKISVEERICRFGEGVFETCRIFNGEIYNFENHLKRLKAGLKSLKIGFLPQDLQELRKNCQKLIAKNNAKNAILRISVSRNSESKGYLPILEKSPLIIAQILPLPKIPAKIVLGVSKIRKPSIKSIPVNSKISGNISSILAKIEAHESGFFDVVMLNGDGFIAESSAANIFWIKNGVIFTPQEDCDILLGTTRKRLLQLLAKNKNFKIKQVKTKIAALKNCDEIFLTNAALGVLPVDEIVFSGKVKKLQQKISKEIAKILKSDLTK